jgi:hypothetical protein
MVAEKKNFEIEWAFAQYEDGMSVATIAKGAKYSAKIYAGYADISFFKENG